MERCYFLENRNKLVLLFNVPLKKCVTLKKISILLKKPVITTLRWNSISNCAS